MTWSIVAATLMVAATTADDAIWLVPYTSPSLPAYTRLVHGALFVSTLELLVCCCVVIATWLQWAVASTQLPFVERKWDEEAILGSIGAGVCYAIALSLYVRKWWRRRWTEGRIPLHRATTRKISNTYGAIDESEEIRDRDECKSLQGDDNDEDDGEASGVPGRPSPWTVISLTTLGALDEVSYFPSLLLGKFFTPLDLCIGTFIAACLILVVVTLFLSQCKPVLDWLDRIPLYGIVLVFALALTTGVILDMISLGR